MTASLCDLVPPEFTQAEDFKKFFGDAGAYYIKRKWESREMLGRTDPKKSCDTNLFFGFFFDGTKNNYRNAVAGNDFSNVAHLYNCYPGESVKGVLGEDSDWRHEPAQHEHFFKIYIPGVASPFSLVNDTGVGDDLTLGAAFGRFGERRIIWALVQAINNVHRYFHKKTLVEKSDLDDMYKRVVLNKNARRLLSESTPLSKPINNVRSAAPDRDTTAFIYFQYLLQRLHSAVSQHWQDNRTGIPKKIDPAIVKTIHISIFGFSRGATQARAFTNWLHSICALDSHILGKKNGLTLGGFNVQFDFLGVFDTVASIGAGNTLGNSIFGRQLDGHSAWADSEDSLRIPSGLQCLHLVAAHEVRRSFPLDSISVGGVISTGCQEIVLPGAHSDVGGGYGPSEQGKGVEAKGADMMSRIPLLMMYKTARLSGVPLKLEHANEEAKKGFRVTPKTISDFNAYIATCVEKQGPIHKIMREHGRKYIEWRTFRKLSGKGSIVKIPSFARASTLHQNDIHSASIEFEQELGAFVQWFKERGARYFSHVQKPGFDNEEKSEWKEIARWWNENAMPTTPVIQFFDEYIHDSRASFKLDGADNANDLRRDLSEWLKRKKFAQSQNDPRGERAMANLDGLDPAKRKAADDFSKTGKIPRMVNSGREPMVYPVYAGYLRFRKIYGGSDEVLLGSVTENLDSDRKFA
ncbi:T6SS phospholipase effector Tle1-like catalytic domain-containing protein [Telluria aromaticivorans]|uniref:DUF2235 domain-containing protein n=1 Tax=Telluria aromaticivorans TaxID=2725995 RepID=A0A7Y2JXE2_9BURK|nr:DUF2235 domain-containing protein [Telluria aromaticivorans]NNG22762.1 DUF2235 domain-containing protein [Telluria aromaticivorans]